MEKYIEELRTHIPKALFDKNAERLRADQCYGDWAACLECVQEMADAWEELNGEGLVWVPGHYETKSFLGTTECAPPLPYPYYHLCYCDENGCYDEEFGKADRLFDFLGAAFVRNIVDKYKFTGEKVSLFCRTGKLSVHEITLTPVPGSNLQMGNSGVVTGILWNGSSVPTEPEAVDLFIQKKATRVAAKNDTMRIQFGNKTFCELKVEAER